jgi:two-component system, OmpR family, KDP operon response regulator KdpE
MNIPSAFSQAASKLLIPAPYQQPHTQPVRILMVDDDVSLCRVMRAVLERQGFALAVEHTIANGLRRVVEERFTLVLLDVVLPDGDGCVALSEFHVLSGLPVIIITGTGGDATREACLGSGAVGYLAKPFSIANLLTMIRHFI